MNKLDSAKRLVVKIGSAILTDAVGIRESWLAALVEDIVALRASDKEVIVVSSGAVACGRLVLEAQHPGLKDRKLKLEEKQAAFACGQVTMMYAWQRAFAAHGTATAQILLTADDTENRRRYLNARNTLDNVLKFGAVPVINENDAISTQELRIGDNDRLGARVAQMAGADCLVLLSDVDGMYTADPRHDSSAEFLPEIHGITPEIEAMAGGSATLAGSGGMATKVAAARIALASGCHMAIVSGHGDHPLERLAEGGKATWFIAAKTPQNARKEWIAGTLKPSGAVTVDEGAASALKSGKSLLPAGVRKIEGSFERGDAIRVLNEAGREIARGLSAYGTVGAKAIAGRKSSEIEAILGFKGRDELIHRDDLVLL
ncbi:MAG: glutamate 5-kinase [Alphaproteobacteria bacterium]|nr:glutamate 5-kinase [Alphaproteobacteria bacterium]